MCEAMSNVLLSSRMVVNAVRMYLRTGIEAIEAMRYLGLTGDKAVRSLTNSTGAQSQSGMIEPLVPELTY